MLRARYTLLNLLGQGAMGEVWRAQDRFASDAGDRNPFLAIKLLNRELEFKADAIVALHREASRAQRLAHPNVCTTYAYDFDENTGQSFIAMELLEGRTLDDVIRDARSRGGLPVKEAMPLIRGMAEGLAYAHRKSIVHSDFKPSNVFITADGIAKVMDFGIARMARAKEAEPSVPHHDDSIFTGYTAGYAAQEAIRKESPDPADDVYSLGLVAYELMSGEHPFGRQPATDAAAAGLAPAPIRGLGHREWLVIRKALAFERVGRWPDASAFLKALQGRQQINAALSVAAVLLLVVASGLGYRNYQQNRPAVPFEDLPTDIQRRVSDALRQGQESLAYVERTGDISASADAAQYFADAYSLHPRDTDAVAGLEEAADRAIRWYRDKGDRSAAEQLRTFEARSPYYRTYRPLQEAIRSLDN